MADNLFNLYDFMKRKLIEGNINKDIESLEIVEEMMLELLETWKQVVNGKSQNQEETDINVQG